MRQKLTKKDSGFAQVKNDVLNDPRLSWRAKGLFAYLYSKPDDWNFSGIRMMNDSKDGRNGTYAGLKELENAGYLRRDKKTDGTVAYFITWQPITQKGEQGTTKPQIKKNTIANSPVPQLRKQGNISNKESYKQITERVGASPTHSPKGEKKPNAHEAFIATFCDMSRKWRSVNPIVTGADKSNLGRVMSKHQVHQDTLEKLALYFLADPDFKKFAPSIRVFVSGGVLTGLLNREKNQPDFYKRMDRYAERYYRTERAALEDTLRAKITALREHLSMGSNTSQNQPPGT